MNRSVFKRQIPTLLALLILFIGAGAGVILVGSGAGFLPRAGPEHQPKQVTITNVSDRSFTISWVTDEQATGFIRYGTTESLGTTVADDRDQLSGQTGSFKAHHITVRSLSPNTQYYFKIGSGSNSSLYDDNGKPYTVSTGESLGASTESETMYGKIVTPAQTPAEGAIVYIAMDGAAPLSTLVKSSGSWTITLSSIRTKDFKQYFNYDKDNQLITLKVLDTTGQTTAGLTDTQNDQPVPVITLGEKFDFTSTSNSDKTVSNQSSTETKTETTSSSEASSSAEIASETEATSSGGFNTAPLGGADEKSDDAEVVFYNPSVEGEKINTTLPEFHGNAPSNTRIFIKVESEQPYEGEIITDNAGDFQWSPPADLEPGSHTITVSYIDSNGIEQFFKRHFVVLAQGESTVPALTASSSATPTPVPTATPKATTTPKPTTVPTATPVSTNSGRTSQPSTESGIPVSGQGTYSFLLALSGGILMILGFFLSRKLTLQSDQTNF